MSAAAGLAVLLAVGVLAFVEAAGAEMPNLVEPRPGAAIATGGVRVRVLPTREMAPEACCVLQFQQWEAGAWRASPIFGEELTVPAVADAVGASFTRKTFAAGTRWRVRARFTKDTQWTEWREFAVSQDAR